MTRITTGYIARGYNKRRKNTMKKIEKSSLPISMSITKKIAKRSPPSIEHITKHIEKKSSLGRERNGGYNMPENKKDCTGCGYWQENYSMRFCIFAMVNGVSRHALLGEWPKPGRCRFYTRIPQRIPLEELPIKRREI